MFELREFLDPMNEKRFTHIRQILSDFHFRKPDSVLSLRIVK